MRHETIIPWSLPKIHAKSVFSQKWLVFDFRKPNSNGLSDLVEKPLALKKIIKCLLKQSAIFLADVGLSD